ncbi:MAG: hypothetical protein QOE94_1281 [Mycobacterium sp.]|jgi:hypothetical protein|nr:hypothetical protein [Mycobacterium sp.]
MRANHHRTAGTTRNCPADHGAHRRQGRAKWRRLQARSVVRDAPTEAGESCCDTSIVGQVGDAQAGESWCGARASNEFLALWGWPRATATIAGRACAD